MKKYNKIFLAFCVSLFTLGGCTDYLDVNPEMGIEPEEVYSEYYAYKGAVDRGNWLVMNYVATSTNWAAYVGAMGDEQQAVKTDMPCYKTINTGLWMNSGWRDLGLSIETDETKYGADPYYNQPAGKSLRAIRAMGLAIQNIGLLTDLPKETVYSEQELKDQLLGQAYALRAWHIFEVIRRYGPIELVNTDNGGREVFDLAYEFDRARPTFQQCADWIAADCDAAAELLPRKWATKTDIGRVTKASALAIKAIAYMYAASPLMNTNNGANPLGQDSYDEVYAKKGIQAMVDVLKEIETGATRYGMYEWDQYSENWMSQDQAVSDEALFQPISTNGEKWSLPMNRGGSGTGWFLPQHDGGWAVFNVPTQNSVDKFETINGYPVSHFASTDPAYDAANPYANRDPRLKNAIFCPGDKMYMSQPHGGDWKPGKETFENQAWSNPTEVYPSEGDATKLHAGYHYEYYKGKGLIHTGYFAAGKWRKLGYNKFDNKYSQNYYRMYPLIRIPDIYLGLAELANEVYGPTGNIPEAAGIEVTTAEQALNKVRNRAGMPGVLASFTADAGAFRNRVRNEWAVEFYGEFKRWRDIRRWRIAKDVLAEGIYKAEITKKPDGTFSYVSKKLDVPRVFEEKHYWYPFDSEHMDKFASFEQNPGW